MTAPDHDELGCPRRMPRSGRIAWAAILTSAATTAALIAAAAFALIGALRG